MNLPEAFAARMKAMLGDDFEAFLAAYDRPNTPALRLNPMKAIGNTDTDKPLLPCLGQPVPWAAHGYYYDPDADLRPGKHPYHEAGAYYIQEASAMIPASLCPPVPGDKVLDLCAAPGGKSTQLAAALGGEGLLVANEIHPQRAGILSQNVERMGIKNAVVTNHAPHELVGHFPVFFDKIVVDAPCSGEGMFRKEEQALTMWTQDNVDLCAARQKEILASAAEMLAPDGYLTYSTCTFAPEENEGVILNFLTSHPEFEVVEPVNPAVLACIEQGLIDRGNPDWVAGGEAYADALRKTVRLFPHHADGEGHFAALLHKSDDAPPAGAAKSKDQGKPKRQGKDFGKGQMTGQMTADKAYKLFEAFSKEVTREALDGVPCLFGDQLYLCPRELPTPPKGLRILRHGLHLGTVKSDRFEPSHALALALDMREAKKSFAVDLPSARAYLHGDVIPCRDEKGWYLVTMDGLALGWGKASDGVVKNHYPKGLRKPY
ncbi:MAG: RsmB/NOP family class I SAM-dependent RNA methyltransferase [Clostridia bacterium]|nr:RsmB/NOP family class I SAM-dependent RNA methyltransferase [Clostridia bacterium]